MEAANYDMAVPETESLEGEAAWSTPEYQVSMEATLVEQESTCDPANLETRQRLFEHDTQNLLRISAGFDPDFDPKHAPRIALLCQTCHTALQTATHLPESEAQRQRLTSEALRVRVWGMDMFNSTNYAPLDELLSLASGRHSSLQHHLTGVWADIAATLELVLFLLIRQERKPSREGLTQWRRLRILLGLDDISTAIHDGFGLPGSFDCDLLYDDAEEVLNGLISSLEGLIDCLFDLVVTISTIRQLHRLGSNQDRLTSTAVRDGEDQRAGSCGAATAAEDSSTSSSPATSDVSDEYYEIRRDLREEWINSIGDLDDWPAYNKISYLSESAPQNVSKKHSSRAANPSRRVVRVDTNQTESVSQKDPSKVISTPQTSKVPVHDAKNSALRPRQNLSANTRRFRKPIKFIDCHDRHFTFPFPLCRTWKDMQDLIKEGFQGMTGPYADATRALIEHGNYDLVSHFDNETIIPSLWSSVLEPGMTVRMVLYQIPPGTYVPSPQFSSNAPHTYQPYEHRPTFSQKATAPSNETQERYNEDEESWKSQHEDGKGYKDSQDDEATSTVSIRIARRPKASSSNVDATSTAQESSSDASPTATVTVKDHKQKQKKADEGREAFVSSRPAHPLPALPSSSSLPNFEDLGVGKEAQHSSVRRRPRSNAIYTKAPTNYIDSAYNSMESVPPSYTRPSLDHYVWPNESVPSDIELVPRNPLPYNQLVVAAPSPNPQSTQPQYLDYSKAYLRLEQMILDDKAVREAREAAARRIKAEKEQFVREQIDAAAAAAAATARLEFARKEADKLAIESEKAEAETKERAAAAAAAANPEPIHLNDPIGRKFTFPYQQCNTWRGIDDLIKGAFVHVESIRSDIFEGRYDLLSPNGDVLLPALWESSIEPGWNVTMALWPTDGYQSLSNTSETQRLPKPDVVFIKDPSTSGSQALSSTLSNPRISPRASAQSMHSFENLPRPEVTSTQEQSSVQEENTTQSDVVRIITNPRNEADTSVSSSEDGEALDEEPEDRRRVARWAHRILHPLRVRKFASTQNDSVDD